MLSIERAKHRQSLRSLSFLMGFLLIVYVSKTENAGSFKPALCELFIHRHERACDDSHDTDDGGAISGNGEGLENAYGCSAGRVAERTLA